MLILDKVITTSMCPLLLALFRFRHNSKHFPKINICPPYLIEYSLGQEKYILETQDTGNFKRGHENSSKI